MKIVCDSCATKYSIADEKVRGKVFKIRCKKCGHVIVVRGGEQVPAAAAAPAPAPVADTGGGSAAATQFAADAPPQGNGGAGDAVWHLVIDREQVGPLTADDVRAKFLAGQVDVEAFAWREGFADWLRLGSIEDFADLQQQPKEKEDDGGGRTMMETEVPAAVASMVAQAKAQQAAAAQAKAQPAQAKKPPEDDDETRRSDASEILAAHKSRHVEEEDGGAAALFAASPVVAPKSRPAMAEPAGGFSAGEEAADALPKLTGQRNENSVLFSLNNLQALATSKNDGGRSPAAHRPGFASAQSEGSGLIDIRAMAAQTLSATPMDASSGSSADMSLSAPPMFGQVAAPVLMPAASTSMPKWVWGVIVAGTVAVVAIVALLVVMIMHKPETPPQYAMLPPPTQQAEKVAVAMPPVAKAEAPTAAAPAAPATADTSPKAEKNEAVAANLKQEKGKKDKVDPRSHKGEKVEVAAARPAKAAPVAKAASPTPAPAEPARKASSRKGGDSLDDLLNQASPAEASSKRARPAAEPAAAAPSSEELPEQLGREDIKRGMSGVQSRVMACYQQYHVPGMALMRVNIGKNGRVSSAEVGGALAGTPSGDCVAKAVKSASFGKFKGDPMSVTYPFMLR